MLHLWLLKMGVQVIYYYATLGYPLLETYKVISQGKMEKPAVKMVAYWIILLALKFVNCLLFFVSGYVLPL